MRIAIAIAIIAVTLAAAVYVHERRLLNPMCIGENPPTPNCYDVRPAWEDPVAIMLGLGGLAIAAAVVGTRRGKRST